MTYDVTNIANKTSKTAIVKSVLLECTSFFEASVLLETKITLN